MERSGIIICVANNERSEWFKAAKTEFIAFVILNRSRWSLFPSGIIYSGDLGVEKYCLENKKSVDSSSKLRAPRALVFIGCGSAALGLSWPEHVSSNLLRAIGRDGPPGRPPRLARRSSPTLDVRQVKPAMF